MLFMIKFNGAFGLALAIALIIRMISAIELDYLNSTNRNIN